MTSRPSIYFLKVYTYTIIFVFSVGGSCVFAFDDPDAGSIGDRRVDEIDGIFCDAVLNAAVCVAPRPSDIVPGILQSFC